LSYERILLVLLVLRCRPLLAADW